MWGDPSIIDLGFQSRAVSFKTQPAHAVLVGRLTMAGHASPFLDDDPIDATRVDDYHAASFVYCSQTQSVLRYDAALAVKDVERLSYEKPSGMEQRLAAVGASVSEGT